MLGKLQELKKLPTILLFINLPQDLDLLLPLAMRLQESCEFRLQMMVSTKAWRCSPRIATLLAATNIEPKLVSHKATVAGLRPSLKGIQAVITASESSAIAHKGAHTLTRRANRRGILTYTLQHGFENVGINYFDTEFPVGAIRFASQTCFIWGSPEYLPSDTPLETREKCVSVGCPKFVLAPHINSASKHSSPLLKETLGRGLIAVFENLHWCRYSHAYRQQFLDHLIQTACAFPQLTFLVKPHHTGQWLTQHSDTLIPAVDNLIIADPKMPEWEAFTAPALIKDADAVITTPSTVAVDAARADCPVAIVAHHTLALNNYEPLPLLRDYQDWQAIALQVSQAVNPLAREPYDDLLAQTRAFAARHILPGDAVGKIVVKLTADIHI